MINSKRFMKGRVLDSSASFVVTLQASGKSFSVQTDETILDASLKAGIILAYGCKNGACGSCKGKILGGEVRMGPHNASTLTEEEEQRKVALLCCSFPLSDCLVSAREIEAGEIPIKKIPCRVADLERVASDVMVLKLQLPSTERFQYRAGQYVEFLLKDGKRRAYSIATPPHEEGPIELHIRHMPGGLFTDHVFGANPNILMKVKDILRFEGPLGSFFLREASDKPMIFIASGTGFAPIKAIIEHTLHEKITRPIYLYWGGRRPSDLYEHEKCLTWAKNHPHIQYIPVISDALAEDTWQGRTGFVHQAAVDDFPDMSGYQVYACGAPVVISSAERDFTSKCQLPEDEFYADSFTSAADLVS
jgi:CDP-4-dehydro-6-deoxyglucose reductase